MDATANNYDAAATIDDGSCTYAVLGCTDPLACNYDVAATVDDGSCISSIATSHLINAGMYYYSPSNLTINIGDTVVWLNDAGYHDVNGDVNSLIGSSYNNPISFYLPATSGPSTIGSYVFTVAGTYNYDCSIGNHAANGMVGSIVVNTTASGCTDPTATNYDPSAICDDGSCNYTISGCTDSTATNYNVTANVDDGSCIYPAAMANLFFSEFAEGSSNNKYFEVYNASTDTVYLSDYAYPSVSNAPSTPGVYEYWNDFDAGAFIAPGDVYVVAHGSADPIILAEADETHNYLSNGDDGYGLVYGTNPGSPLDAVAGGYVILDFIGD
jgi:plastocyanin